MVTWLGELYGLDKLDAYQLLSQISEAPLANVVDANYSAVTMVAKALLPPADAYRGMHPVPRAHAHLPLLRLADVDARRAVVRHDLDGQIVTRAQRHAEVRRRGTAGRI